MSIIVPLESSLFLSRVFLVYFFYFKCLSSVSLNSLKREWMTTSVHVLKLDMDPLFWFLTQQFLGFSIDIQNFTLASSKKNVMWIKQVWSFQKASNETWENPYSSTDVKCKTDLLRGPYQNFIQSMGEPLTMKTSLIFLVVICISYAKAQNTQPTCADGWQLVNTNCFCEKATGKKSYLPGVEVNIINNIIFLYLVVASRRP